MPNKPSSVWTPIFIDLRDFCAIIQAVKDLKETALYFFISVLVVSGVLFALLLVPSKLVGIILSIGLALFIFIGFIFFLCLLNYIFKHAKCIALDVFVPPSK